ncbi:MAG TPA: undecaprenyl-diphosphate phosphatase [Bryobacteraceae bacterium]|nr:undecaprenyl-diphosphate phosphatase [Bryobacteraceae bacterium]
MPLYQVIVMAIVQSLTEFLPISSTAHLALVPRLLGWTSPELHSLDFDIALHVGTLAAVIVYFFRDWVQLVAQGFGLRIGGDPALAQNRNLLWLLAAATVPVGVFGYFFKDLAEGPLRNAFVIGTMLIVVGIVMYIADRAGHFKKDLDQISLADSMLIGLAQAVAIVPGVSRSGITISTGLFRNLNRHAAARFSFLLSTPALTGAALKAFLDIQEAGGLSPGMQVPFLVGVVVSAVTGWVVIAVFLRFLRTHTLRFFVYYRIIFGIIVIALAIFVRRAG